MEITTAVKLPEYPSLIVTNNNNNNSNYRPQELTFLLKLPAHGPNTTQPKAPQKHTVSKTDAAGIAKIIFGASGDFLEMLVLYSFPLVFLAKLHKIMTNLPEVVQDLKFNEQIENGYLFQDEKILNEMNGKTFTRKSSTRPKENIVLA
ncbi:hypothetical protein OS493_033568 [Desmophyllum pertusum]|uniref:Uncharacterized protein n=1 Tax=Desmophyllum pertusum TaxID=174260 RepID=A0A9W9YY83_9CNID|nr:hypothetical protein OS493_033568 [Desmophyllum pertusum]